MKTFELGFIPFTVGPFAAVLTYLAVLVDVAALEELCLAALTVLVDVAALGELCLAALTGTFPEFIITAIGTKCL
nr:hypothetical protein [Tanacetum cinerariifolium]